jgi:hypothetical protein
MCFSSPALLGTNPQRLQAYCSFHKPITVIRILGLIQKHNKISVCRITTSKQEVDQTANADARSPALVRYRQDLLLAHRFLTEKSSMKVFVLSLILILLPISVMHLFGEPIVSQNRILRQEMEFTTISSGGAAADSFFSMS